MFVVRLAQDPEQSRRVSRARTNSRVWYHAHDRHGSRLELVTLSTESGGLRGFKEINDGRHDKRPDEADDEIKHPGKLGY